MLPNFQYSKPGSLVEAVQLARRPGAHLHAGGTDLLGCLRDRLFPADRIVSLQGLEALRGIAAGADGGLRIGALTTLTEIAESGIVRDRFGALARAAASVASPQLRNQGTLGGNLCQRPRCWYYRGAFDCVRRGGATCYAVNGENRYHAIFGGNGCYMVHPSDCATALAALRARVRIAGPGGARTIPIESFFVLPRQSLVKENVLEPGEILTDVLLPPAPAGHRSTYRKVRERASWNFALVGVGVALTVADGTIRDAAVVLSGVAPAPWRAREAERAIVGRTLDVTVAAAAGRAAVAGAEPLEQNAYKIQLAQAVVEEALEELSKEA